MELAPAEIDVHGPDVLQQTMSPTREMPQSQAPEPENPAQPRRSPRFSAKEPDAMPLKKSNRDREPIFHDEKLPFQTISASSPRPASTCLAPRPTHRRLSQATGLRRRSTSRSLHQANPSPPPRLIPPATKRRGRLSKTTELAKSSLNIPQPTVPYKNPEAQPRGRPHKTIALPQPPSNIPNGTAPSKKAQPKRRGRSPKATRLAGSPPNTPEAVALPKKTQAKRKGWYPKAPGARKTATKAEKSATKRSGRPFNTTSLTQRPSKISKPAARSKNSQAKPKESPLPALLTEDKHAPGKAAGRKTGRATDMPGDVVSTKEHPTREGERAVPETDSGSNLIPEAEKRSTQEV
ncbi:unnamed protein product [Clonostachys chloroleuca]|uniref:Uncharacterized protein n=1 Tax=Clonostachys chloroleuca TaxID=1926264 RepID=A0AA35LRR8_9HYPO|nr:unnamed protein product [Clonostachys chloroleuca]